MLDQDLVVALDPAREVNNPPGAAHQTPRGPRPEAWRAHRPCRRRAGYYSAILAELVGPSVRVTAVEFDAALAERAKSFLSGRTNVRVVCDDGARWPETPADGVYVNFAVARPADRWVEGLAPGGRLVFPLGVPGPKRPNSGGRHSDRGAALRIERRGNAYAARAISTAYFVCAEGEFEVDPEEVERLRAAFDAGGLDTVRSLIWKRPALSDRCWFAGFVSRRSAMSAPDRTASGGFDIGPRNIGALEHRRLAEIAGGCTSKPVPEIELRRAPALPQRSKAPSAMRVVSGGAPAIFDVHQREIALDGLSRVPKAIAASQTASGEVERVAACCKRGNAPVVSQFEFARQVGCAALAFTPGCIRALLTAGLRAIRVVLR